VFAAVLALVLAATGTFVYLRMQTELTATIDRALRSRAADVTALVQQADTGLRDAGRGGQQPAQILDARGRVFDATPGLRGGPVLTRDRLRRALRGRLVIDANGARLLAVPVRAQDQQLIVVVAASLRGRDATLHRLGTLLLIGGPIALLVASSAGYLLAGAALRPVESMRRRAEAISDDNPGDRLPVPRRDDEIARLGTTLNGMLDRLDAGLARERGFVADAGHELRTPLAVLKGELEIARGRARGDGELGTALASAEEEADRLAHLADDLLVIARSDRGRLPLRGERLDVDAIFAGALKRARRRRPPLEIAGHADPMLEIDADPTRIGQALDNLVDNAVRHGRPPIELSARRAGGWVELHVVDRGDGFSTPYLPHAFKRFSRADAARGAGGSGLGLAIVQAIAGAHGGTAHAANRPDGGADVWLRLPAFRNRPGANG